MKQDNKDTIVIRPLRRQFLVNRLPACMLLLILVIIPGLDIQLPSSIHTALWISSALTFMWILCHFIYLRSMRYEISMEQLTFRHGVLSMKKDYVELYRVTDYEEYQNLLQYMFGVKTVSVMSGDRTTPKLDIIGVPSSLDIIAELRKRVEYNKQKNGVYEITNR